MRVGSRRNLVAIVVLVAAVVVAPFALAEGAYRWALQEVGGPPEDPVVHTIPGLAAASFWLHAGEEPPLVVEPRSAWRWLWDLVRDSPGMMTDPKGWRAASLAARSWLADRPVSNRPLRWDLAYLAATVWTSGHWDAVQMTQAWLERAWFGRGAWGIDVAARSYFGKPSAALAPHELALLVALTSAPGRLDPYCYPDRAIAARDGLLRRLSMAGLLSEAAYRASTAMGLGVVAGTCVRTE